jgi:hypothetical protein
MNYLRTLNSAIFGAAILAAFGAKANAAVVPVVDQYFDEFPTGFSAANYFQVGCGTGCAFADLPIVGWTSSVTRSASGDSGQWETGVPYTTTAFNSDPLEDGTTAEPIVVRAINATVSQIVSTTAVAGVTYTLDVDLGFEKTAPDAASVFLIVDGHQVKATPLASYGLTQTQMQGTGNWYDFEASYTAISADVGDSIEILLSSQTNGNGFGFFGNVQLTDSLPALDSPAAPEPSTWAMILIGFGGMAGAAAMRRRRSAAVQFV